MEENLLEYLKSLYKSEGETVFKEIKRGIKKAKHIKPVYENPYWYKFIDLYFVYPDGIVYDKSKSPLLNLIPHIGYIKTLGCNAMHILPFLESPMIDRGFDISDYYAIRKDLGTMEDLQKVINEAEKAHVRLFMDLVFNHVSHHHEWFQKAQKGDEYYRNFFITSKEKPHFIKKYHKDAAVWADYEVNGKTISVNIAFPEYTGPIPHWTQGEDGIWYYHTYYPQQLDLNWKNPQVFLEVAKVLMYWASFGFSFRLDAIPFVGKSAYKAVDGDNEKTFLITAALKCISEEINPQSVFVVETYENLDTVIDYFGTSNRVQANLSYNFHLCTNVWVSLIKNNASFIWDKLNKQSNIPKQAEWLNFLRNHDELSLAYLPDDLTQEVRKAIIKYGKDFREGYGVAGRTFSLLGFTIKRFLMAYFLIASLPGGMVIPYGDEIAHRNIPLKKLKKKDRKDTRNINRGIISAKEFSLKKSKDISEQFATILEKRKQLRDYLNVWPEKLKTPKEIFGARYTLGTSKLLIYVNLSDNEYDLKISLKTFHPIAHINAINIQQKDGKISLGPYAGIWLQK
jgi:maltose alpha-D-glucosyltransferase/alpha-amylase